MAVTRRTTLGALPALALATPRLAHSQSAWPDHPVRVIVPYAPGGSSDVLARLLAPSLTVALGQSIVIENRGGAGSLVGTEVAAHAPADGYTFLLADMPHTIVPAIQEASGQHLSYDAITSFAPVTLIGIAPLLLFANPGVPARDAAEFVAAAKEAPDKFSIASAGSGSTTHLMAELLQRRAGIHLTHVPYRGAGPAMQDVVAGQVDSIFTTMPTAAAPLSAGQVKPLGVSAPTRLPDLPAVPTLREQGIDLAVQHWWGMLAPAGTPLVETARMAEALTHAMADPALAPRLSALGVIPRTTGPDAFAALLREESVRWRGVVQEAGIRAQ